MNGSELPTVMAALGLFSRIGRPPRLSLSVGSLFLWSNRLNGDLQEAWLLGHRRTAKKRAWLPARLSPHFVIQFPWGSIASHGGRVVTCIIGIMVIAALVIGAVVLGDRTFVSQRN
jgi:hypothetical protein